MADKKVESIEAVKVVKGGKDLEGFGVLKQPDHSKFLEKGDIKTVESSVAHDKSETVGGINSGKQSKFGRS